MKLPSISYLVAFVAGVVVLVGYFLPLGELRGIFLEWVIILAAFALLLGVINLFQVHMVKILRGQPGSVYSLVVIASMILTILIVAIFGPTHPASMWIFNYIQVPIEASLMALLAVILVYASVRLLRRQINGLSVVFIFTVLIVLVGSTPLYYFGEVGGLKIVRDWLVQVFAVAGARGILLGVALGTTATALRILMGRDRPYGG